MKCPKCKRICDCATAEDAPEPTEEMVKDLYDDHCRSTTYSDDRVYNEGLRKGLRVLRAALAAAQKEG